MYRAVVPVWISATFLQERESTNTKKEFKAVLNGLRDELGEEAIKNMHIHISGISSNSKGDLKHINLENSNFNWKELIEALKEEDCRGYVICNSPQPRGRRKNAKRLLHVTVENEMKTGPLRFFCFSLGRDIESPLVLYIGFYVIDISNFPHSAHCVSTELSFSLL